MKQFTFEKENFQPDYIAFKFTELDWFNKKDILSYLFSFGFNIYEEVLTKANQKRIHSKNKFKIYQVVIFRRLF